VLFQTCFNYQEQFASAPQPTVILKTSARIVMTDRRAFAASLQGAVLKLSASISKRLHPDGVIASRLPHLALRNNSCGETTCSYISAGLKNKNVCMVKLAELFKICFNYHEQFASAPQLTVILKTF